jgi:hypothetical protein
MSKRGLRLELSLCDRANDLCVGGGISLFLQLTHLLEFAVE